jgi:protoporphyrinogen oxidase
VTAQPASVAIIGAGYTGLAAAWELTRAGHKVTVYEADEDIGGLAGTFSIGDARLEKFYHHWFTNDVHIMELIQELGCTDQVLYRESNTGNYYANQIFRLSTPLDVLRYKPLSFINRVRLGLIVLQARMVRDWRKLEAVTAADWIRAKAGDTVFEKVWWPLLQGKFGSYADKVSAVWFWKKLVLRGGSRGKGGSEILAYYRGGFAALAQRLAEEIRQQGGEIKLGVPVTSLTSDGQRVTGVVTPRGSSAADIVINTTALPIAAEIFRSVLPEDYLQQLGQIDYLGNVCLTLVLERSLSDTYWINVTDPGFPFVGIIEHTNFEPTSSYGGKHIVYLSKYLPTDDKLYSMSDQEVFDFSLPHISAMFPDFDENWVCSWHVYRAQYSQPIVGKHYSKLIPDQQTPLRNLYLATMAQIYPEDRGTNYAIREGRRIGQLLAGSNG